MASGAKKASSTASASGSRSIASKKDQVASAITSPRAPWNSHMSRVIGRAPRACQ